MQLPARFLQSLAIVAGLLLGSSLVVTPTMAASITYNFTGDVTGVHTQLSSQFNDSQTMSGFIKVNTTDLNPLSNTGLYSIEDFKVMIGTYTATMGPAGVVEITNGSSGAGADRFNAMLESPAGINVNSLGLNFFDILLRGPSSTFTSAALLFPAPSVGSFNHTNEFRLAFGPGGGRRIEGFLTSLTAVPLPAAVVLFGAGLVALIGLGAGGLRNLRVPQA